jgi:ankyrin repeat protein
MDMLGGEDEQPRVYAKIKMQLAAGADPNTQGGWGTSPLMFLAYQGDIEAVRDLLRHKVNVNLVDVYGSTALLHAANNGNKEMVALLLEAGAELKNEQGKSLLPLKGDYQALGVEMLRILKLRERGFNDQISRSVAIGDIAWMLLYLGADPNARDAENGAPLLFAYDSLLMKELLERGANTATTLRRVGGSFPQRHPTSLMVGPRLGLAPARRSTRSSGWSTRPPMRSAWTRPSSG